ncbi:hypothetical protein Tcan_00837, partial [Toxocara canis]
MWQTKINWPFHLAFLYSKQGNLKLGIWTSTIHPESAFGKRHHCLKRRAPARRKGNEHTTQRTPATFFAAHIPFCPTFLAASMHYKRQPYTQTIKNKQAAHTK